MASSEYQTWQRRFYSTGDICPLKLGATRDEVRSLFGEPDDVSCVSQKDHHPAIWKYEELEFHFGDKLSDTLFLVYQDTVDGVQVSIARRIRNQAG